MNQEDVKVPLVSRSEADEPLTYGAKKRLVVPIVVIIILAGSTTAILLTHMSENVPEWEDVGRLKILQISDVHGWVNGHTRQPPQNATFAHLRALIEILRNSSNNAGIDFLAIDSGDQIEGTGLSDATDPPGMLIWDVFSKVGLDALTVGNHDIFAAGEYIHEKSEELFQDRYITSNTWAVSDNKPLGSSQYRVFNLQHSNLRVLVLGFLYNYDTIDPAFRLIDAAEQLYDPLFRKAILDAKPNFVISLCHIASDDEVMTRLVPYMRSLFGENVPLLFASGHTHRWRQLECKGEDGSVIPQCTIIEPGRYFEHISMLDISFQRRNKATRWESTPVPLHFEHPDFTSTGFLGHLIGKNDIVEYMSSTALEIKTFMDEATTELKLNEVVGCLDSPIYANGFFNDSSSMFNYWSHKAFPIVGWKLIPLPRPQDTVLVINSYAARADLYQGENTLDDIFSAFPFNISLWDMHLITGPDLTPDKIYSGFFNEKPPAGPFPVPKRPDNPHWITSYYSLNELNRNSTYDILTAKYNAQIILSNMKNNFPDKEFSIVEVGNVGFFKVFYEYFKEYEPC